MKPNDFPGIFEVPQKVFGRNRKIRPFARAHVYQNPDRQPGPVSSHHDAGYLSIIKFCVWYIAQLLEEENPFVGPTSYTPHHDTWQETKKPVCGVVK
jgi:hypothetical protein